MSQPNWKLIANLGDVNPLDYGGYFVYIDTTGVYEAEAELLTVAEDGNEIRGYTIHRFLLDKCTFIDGILSDNDFHPGCPAWFAKPESERAARSQDTTYLKNVADFVGTSNGGETEDILIQMFCSDNPVERAEAYRAVGEYHGFDNLDQYPLKFKSNQRGEVAKRYQGLKELKGKS